MTCRYNEINQHDALYLAARKYPGGVEALAQRLGMHAGTLYNKLRPGVTTHIVSFEELSHILELLEDAGVPEAEQVFDAFLWRHGRVAMRLPHASITDDQLLSGVLQMLQCEGELAREISSALSNDGKISDKEYSEIDNDLQKSIEALVSLRERVRAKHKTDSGL